MTEKDNNNKQELMKNFKNEIEKIISSAQKELEALLKNSDTTNKL